MPSFNTRIQAFVQLLVGLKGLVVLFCSSRLQPPKFSNKFFSTKLSFFVFVFLAHNFVIHVLGRMTRYSTFRFALNNISALRYLKVQMSEKIFFSWLVSHLNGSLPLSTGVEWFVVDDNRQSIPFQNPHFHSRGSHLIGTIARNQNICRAFRSPNLVLNKNVKFVSDCSSPLQRKVGISLFESEIAFWASLSERPFPQNKWKRPAHETKEADSSLRHLFLAMLLGKMTTT